jgi:hypothetical protein
MSGERGTEAIDLGTQRSAKSGLPQPVEHTVASLLRAELPRENLGIEERGEVQDDGTLALRILISSHLAINGREKRARLDLYCSSGTARQGAITALDGLGVATKKKIRKA